MNSPLAGLLAEFDSPEELLHAAEAARTAGFLHLNAYSPFPVTGLAHVLGHDRSPIPLITLASGITGGSAGYFMQWYAMKVDYPLEVGGRPLHSWPAFVPITFELTVLGAALAALISMLALNRLPHPYHPVFNVPAFARASTDRFFLCIESADPNFDLVATRGFLEKLQPLTISEVAE